MGSTSIEDMNELIGFVFGGKWKVVSVHTSGGNPTGGIYSMCFDVTDGENTYFMKALDFNQYIRRAEEKEKKVDYVACLNSMTEQYLYERDLSKHCREKKVKNVACMIDDGQEFVKQLGMVVPYLVFDMASCDLREKLDISEQLDFAWKMKLLHDVAVGLNSLHNARITHQDIKPSNILLYEESNHEYTKIGDLGRSTCEAITSPFEDLLFTGDHTYAPPERDYNIRYYNDEDQKYLTDCYLLGSLVVFCITGVSMNALLYQYLPESSHPGRFTGKYDQLNADLHQAFMTAVENIRPCIPETKYKDKLVETIQYLCHPDTTKRGHPKNLSQKNGKPYRLERFVSILDLIHRQAEIEAFKHH